MRKYYPSLIFLIAFFFFSVAAVAQTSVSGKVSDAQNGEPLTGVNIVVKGRVIGTITDADGKFDLKISDNPPLTLVVSYVGYRSFEIAITNATTTGIDVKLEE